MVELIEEDKTEATMMPAAAKSPEVPENQTKGAERGSIRAHSVDPSPQCTAVEDRCAARRQPGAQSHGEAGRGVERNAVTRVRQINEQA